METLYIHTHAHTYMSTPKSVTVARPHIIAGLFERSLSTNFALQTASGETLTILRKFQ